jgi:hypothetical protein
MAYVSVIFGLMLQSVAEFGVKIMWGKKKVKEVLCVFQKSFSNATGKYLEF